MTKLWEKEGGGYAKLTGSLHNSSRLLWLLTLGEPDCNDSTSGTFRARLHSSPKADDVFLGAGGACWGGLVTMGRGAMRLVGRCIDSISFTTDCQSLVSTPFKLFASGTGLAAPTGLPAQDPVSLVRTFIVTPAAIS